MARNQATNLKMKEDRRERILLGALELFALNGLAGTKITDIARHTEMSNGLIYHYFPTKEGIFVELIKVAFERMLSACDQLQTISMAPHEKIHHAITKMILTFRTRPSASLYHLLITQATAAKNIPEAAREILHSSDRMKPITTIAEILAEGQNLGTICSGNPEDLAFFFWININGIAMHHAMYGEKARNPNLTPLFRMLFTDGENTVHE